MSPSAARPMQGADGPEYWPCRRPDVPLSTVPCACTGYTARAEPVVPLDDQRDAGMAELLYATIIAVLTDPLVLLFALLALAYGADRLVRAAGRLLPLMILLVAPPVGWIARYEFPGEIRDLGLVMFLYVIGLETGGTFFPTFLGTGDAFCWSVCWQVRSPRPWRG